jgi:hypothetical protein
MIRRYNQSNGMTVSTKTYWQVGAAALLLISSLLVWIALKEHSSVYQDNYMQKSAVFFPYKYAVEYRKEGQGETTEYYSFDTPDKTVTDLVKEERNARLIEAVERKIEAIIRSESDLYRYVTLLVYTVWCWGILRNDPSLKERHGIALMFCLYFAISIGRIWLDISQDDEQIGRYLSRL